MSVKAQEKQIDLSLEVDGLIPETIQSDPARLRQILTNLVGNALKFTDTGGVTIRLACDTSSAPPRLRFDVIDTGIGIAPEKVAAVFEPFVQADHSVNRRFGGTGLGLAISRRFAHALGGDIVASSTPGQGSTFSATVATGDLHGIRMLGADALATTTETATTPAPTRWVFPEGARILVVDDGDENRELIATVLGEHRVSPDEAENGEVAVRKALAQAYDLILMDMQMPVMDGFEATRALREAGCDTPIVALTANAMQGYEQEVIAAGCTGYLTKPVDIDALLATIAEVVGGRRQTLAPTQTHDRAAALPSAATRSESTDEVPIRSRFAERPRMQAIIGRFIVRLRAALPDFARALADADMGELERLAHWLKGAGGTIGFDEFTEPAGELEVAAKCADRAGCARWLSEITELSARLVVAGPAVPCEATPPTVTAHDAPATEPVGSSLAGNTRLHGVINKFVARMHRQIPAFESAFEAKDFAGLESLAHWLKGAAGTVGFHQFTEPADGLEQAARQRDIAASEYHLRTLQDIASRMQAPAPLIEAAGDTP